MGDLDHAVALCLDVGYYLGDVKMLPHVFYSIMIFPPIIGKWQLPAAQGFVKVTERFDERTGLIQMRINMQTKGCDRWYQHPLVVPS